jgi:hypothetical protein
MMTLRTPCSRSPRARLPVRCQAIRSGMFDSQVPSKHPLNVPSDPNFSLEMGSIMERQLVFAGSFKTESVSAASGSNPKARDSATN